MHRLSRTIYIAIVSLSALSFFVGSTPAADWASFRGPTGDGVSTATKLPIKWSVSDNVAWKTPINGQGWSSPVLRNGVLYLTNAVAEDGEAVQTSYQLNTLALDAQSGKVLWSVKIFDQPVDSAKIQQGRASGRGTISKYFFIIL